MKPLIMKVIDNTVKVGYSGKQIGKTNMGLGEDTNQNFVKFASYFPDKKIYDMPAVGKDNILVVDGLTPKQVFGIEADALITTDSSKLLALKSADCIPLVFYVPGQDILVLAHVGTSGAALHLPSKVVSKLNYPKAEIHCYVGPSVSKKSYRFTDHESVVKKNLDSSWQKYITQGSDGTHINLLGYVLDELSASGLSMQNIILENVDTGSDSNYYSHRKYKLTGEGNGRNILGVCLTS